MAMGDLLCLSFGAGRALASFFESMAEAAKEGKKALALAGETGGVTAAALPQKNQGIKSRERVRP